MYRVMIVEDEFIVRYGIRSMIDWEKIGMELAGEAGNGKEALELMQAGLPDILITDIKMPVMDGIELIAEVRRSSPELKIIILSNLEDFQYAKEAIKHGVSEYLVKSDMMPRDFEQALLNVKTKLDAAREERSSQAKSEEPAPRRREKFLAELIEGADGEAAAAARKAESLGMGPLRSAYVLHISLNAAELGFAEKQSAVRQTLSQAWADGQLGCEAFPDKQGDLNLLCLCGEEDGLAQVTGKAEEWIRLLAAQSGLTATVGIGGPIREWTEAKGAYEQAVWAAKQRMFLGGGRAIVHGLSGGRRSGEPPPEQIRVASNQLRAMAYASQSRELAAYLEQLFGRLADRRDPDLVPIVSLELLMILTTLWSDVSNDDRQLSELKKQYYDQLSKLETLKESKRWFLAAFEALAQHIARMYNSDRNSIMKAVQYIRQYYHQDISLQAISGYVHLSKNYFANLFKKEMGESFLECLTRIRIEKAKELLKRELKATDVGSLVGIQDPKYFSKVFKKITGVSPSEYRHLAREGKPPESAEPANAYPNVD
ncbi:response regulator [Cohnella zeiphila]|uniref:Response regulator n=1 Tax=Cohnella zeiphila TaxID=2761120 RepID=A0A7X0SPW7_9BACL|nr:response regulator [Cohnella zeiphila]MBB6733985.1 response regulator [Cohnella zeiphila]